VAARNLALDTVTAEVVSAMRAAGCDPILLKGPSIARWLYPPGERGYVDIDILLPPSQLGQGHDVLSGLGFEGEGWLDSQEDRPFRRSRRRKTVEVDVHGILGGLEAVDPTLLWEELETRTENMKVGGVEARVLAPGARALHLALHALDHEAQRNGIPFADLERALESLPYPVWEDAAALAKAIGAEPQFAAGLRQSPRGAEVASDLGLPEAVPFWLSMRRDEKGTSADLALGVDWWLHASVATKARIGLRKLFPKPSYLRARSHLARLGAPGLVAAYVARPFVVAVRAVRGAIARRSARGPKDDS
jgi:hypothetical protein